MLFKVLMILWMIFTCCCSSPTKRVENPSTSENFKQFWYEKNMRLINEKLSRLNLKAESLPKVKNVILFIGDGMGSTSLTATRVFKKQKFSNNDERLIFDDFQATAFVQTDSLNSQIPDSASAATALFCGVKTNFEYIGYDASDDPFSCINKEAETQSIISWAQQKNLKTGLVTTARLTHATPAALFSHSRRHMEDDTKVNVTSNCKDIARQLIENETGKRLNVVLGGGLRSFLPKSNGTHPRGRRSDERNLTDEWLIEHDDGDYVTNRRELEETTANHVLGIFSMSHLRFKADQNEHQPSLTEMTTKAIKLLTTNNENGFLLIVESAKIDLAHHLNNAYRALDETLELDKAVAEAMKSVDMEETLIIVTSDHSSAITYSGFATPKSFSILGMDKFLSDVDKKPYQLLMYASGPGYQHFNETTTKQDPKNSYHKATIPMVWGNHDATDVPLYAEGPLSNILFSGTFDQSYVAHAIAFAMCLFQYENRCENSTFNDDKLPTIEEEEFAKGDDYDEEYFIATTENIETSGDDDVILTHESENSTETLQELHTFSHLEDSKANFIDANLSSSSSSYSILLLLPISCIITVSFFNLFC